MDSRPLLVLDMDETLIHSTDTPLDTGLTPSFTFEQYSVYKRPFVDKFLAVGAEHYQLAVWSAGTQDYVEFVIGQLMAEHAKPLFVWSRNRCQPRFDFESQKHYYLKDLSKVKRKGFSLARTLIVEDTPEVCRKNFGNAIYVRAFTGDPGDSELDNLAKYLASLADKPNFRAIEKRNWRSDAAAL